MLGKIYSAYLFVQHRLAEPSTHASVAAVGLLVGQNIDAGPIHDWSVVASLLFGVLGIFVSEKTQ